MSCLWSPFNQFSYLWTTPFWWRYLTTEVTFSMTALASRSLEKTFNKIFLLSKGWIDVQWNFNLHTFTIYVVQLSDIFIIFYFFLFRPKSSKALILMKKSLKKNPDISVILVFNEVNFFSFCIAFSLGLTFRHDLSCQDYSAH